MIFSQLSPKMGLLLAMFSGLAFTAISCSKPSSSELDSGTSPESSVNASSAENSANGRLTLGDEKTLSEWLERSRGRVVLVDFWATWCGPCVQQFPHTVELSRLHGPQGFTVFSVSMDEPESELEVGDFLAKRNVDFDSLLTRYGAGAEFVNAFNIRGDVPFYRLYDRKGALRFCFSAEPDGIENGEPMEMMDRRIKELLSEVP